jgi:ketosteroid isomerase-like protein
MPEEPTTPDLEAIWRRAIDAWNRADFDAVLAVYSPDVVWDETAVGIGVFEGREAIRRLWGEWRGAFSGAELAVEEFHDLGNHVTVSWIRLSGELAGAEVVEHRAYAATWSDGLIERINVHMTVGEARAGAEQLASKNLDLVRSIYADWERGDWSRADWADPEIEFVVADGPAPGRWKGLTDMPVGVRTSVIDAWEDYRAEATEYRDLEQERVLVLFRGVGRGKASGISLERLTRGEQGVSVFDIRDGKVSRIVLYYDRDHAFTDLGLED